MCRFRGQVQVLSMMNLKTDEDKTSDFNRWSFLCTANRSCISASCDCKDKHNHVQYSEKGIPFQNVYLSSQPLSFFFSSGLQYWIRRITSDFVVLKSFYWSNICNREENQEFVFFQLHVYCIEYDVSTRKLGSLKLWAGKNIQAGLFEQTYQCKLLLRT